MNKSEAYNLIPFYKSANENLKKELANISIYKSFPKSTFISLQGDKCKYISFIASGRARVYKLGETGREITLYRLEPGESCILTASCILSQKVFPAIAIAETNIEALLIHSEFFRGWISTYEEVRNYVFNLLSERLSEVIAVVEEIAFKNMDIRIAKFLITMKSNKNEVKVTHQEIAGELGTSREVVSRILKDFEHEQIVNLSRGNILIKNLEKLESRLRKI